MCFKDHCHGFRALNSAHMFLWHASKYVKVEKRSDNGVLVDLPVTNASFGKNALWF